MVSATALYESQDKKVLIFSTNPAHSLSDSFDMKIGNKITKINENLDALEIDAGELLDDYKKRMEE